MLPGDFDGDGDLDVAVANNTGDSLVYFNNGDATFDGTSEFGKPGPVGDPTLSLAAADFDGDGDLDLAAGDMQSQSAVYLNSGDGTFGSRVDFGTSLEHIESLDWGDFDGDGDPDLLAGNLESQNAVYLNNGDGSFGSTIAFGVGSDYTREAAWGDFDGDGDLDVAIANDGQQSAVYLNKAFYDISVEKSDVKDPIPAGWTQQYTLVVSNLGDADLPDVIVTDTLPPGTLHQGATPAGDWNPDTGTVVWNLGSIASDQSETIQLYVHTLSNTAPGTVLHNEVEVTSSAGVSDTDSADTRQ